MGREFSLGWHPVDPGPGPRSPLLNRPPGATSNYVQEYQRWRSAVEAHEARLLQSHLATPMWFPVPLPTGINVLPVYGGTPLAIEQIATTLVMSALESGMKMARVVNISPWALSTSLRDSMAGARRNRAQFDEISGRGSSADLFGNPKPDRLISLVVDALRLSAEKSAGRQAQQERIELEKVAALLAPPVTLERLCHAVDVALGSVAAPSELSPNELRDLRDYFASVVRQRRATGDRLADLHVDLQGLRSFEKAPQRSPEFAGNGQTTTVRWYDVAAGASTEQVELGRELLSRAVLQSFSAGGTNELLVIVGAERLADEVLDGVVGAAERLRKQTALIFTHFSDSGQRLLGYAGSSVALFLRMPNPADATRAAEFLGREYKFVVNGVSIAEGQTQEWSDAYGTSSSSGTTRSSSSGRSSGFSGMAMNWSHNVGSSVSNSFQQGSSQTRTHGHSTSSTTTTSTGRVHEFVIEPEVFQQMPEQLMFVVGNRTVTVASCDDSLRQSKLTSKSSVIVP